MLVGLTPFPCQRIGHTSLACCHYSINLVICKINYVNFVTVDLHENT